VIFIELAESEQPPLHLYLGEDAYNRAFGKLEAMTAEIKEWSLQPFQQIINNITRSD
jgi:hypothetical protein